MRDRLRPLLAAFLAVVLPGLGHVLLRRWGRALVWHGTIVGGTLALYVLYDVEPADPLADPTEFAAAIPPEVSLPVAFLVALSAVDAYLVGREDAAAATRAEATEAALRRRSGSEQGETASPGETPDEAAVLDLSETDDVADALDATGVDDGDDAAPAEVQCPHCGRETDAELDFCHWCTEPLPWADEE